MSFLSVFAFLLLLGFSLGTCYVSHITCLQILHQLESHIYPFVETSKKTTVYLLPPLPHNIELFSSLNMYPLVYEKPHTYDHLGACVGSSPSSCPLNISLPYP